MTTNICVDTAMIQIFGWITKTYLRKVEFNCKVQLSRWPLLDVPFALRVPMCAIYQCTHVSQVYIHV